MVQRGNAGRRDGANWSEPRLRELWSGPGTKPFDKARQGSTAEQQGNARGTLMMMWGLGKTVRVEMELQSFEGSGIQLMARAVRNKIAAAGVCLKSLFDGI